MNIQCLGKGCVLFMLSMSAFCMNHWHFNELKRNYPEQYRMPPIIWNGNTITKSDLFQQEVTQRNHQEKSDQLFKMITGNYVSRLMNMVDIIFNIIAVCQTLKAAEFEEVKNPLKSVVNELDESIYQVEIDITKYGKPVPDVVIKLKEDVEEIKLKENYNLKFLRSKFFKYADLFKDFFKGEYDVSDYDVFNVSKKLIHKARYPEPGKINYSTALFRELYRGVELLKKQIQEDIKIRTHNG